MVVMRAAADKDGRWQLVQAALESDTVVELKQALVAQGKDPHPGSMYDDLERIWTVVRCREHREVLIRWGKPSFKFLLIRYGIMRHSDRKEAMAREEAELEMFDDEDEEEEGEVETEDGEKEEEEEDDVPFELKPDLLAGEVLRAHPEVIREIWREGTGKGMNLVHHAVSYDDADFITTILQLLRDGIIPDPETLLVKSSDDCDSPLIMIIRRRLLPMFRIILQTLPALCIDDSILRQAIDLQRNEMLLALAELRPDCLTVELVQYSVRKKQTQLLTQILKNRIAIVLGKGILHYAVGQGNEEVIQILLEHCGDLATEECSGVSALHLLQQADVVAKVDAEARKRIRSLILPHIIRRTTASDSGPALHIHQIRKLLDDPEGQRKEISLDLGGFRHSSRSIEPFLRMINKSPSANAAGQTMGSLLTVEFETALRYVDVPVPPLPTHDLGSPSIPERQEAKLVLEWLRGSKHVREIYELRVRDSLYLPHTEDVLRQCLDGFNVEVLDWMRVDISAKPLINTCPHLKRLTLYVSSWATLSYWVSGSGYEELANFPKLLNVEIFVLSDLIGPSSSKYESEARNCEAASRMKLASQDPPIEVKFSVKIYTRSWGSLTTRQSEPPSVRKSTPLEVTQLGSYIEAYTLLQGEFQDPDFREENDADAVLSPIINVAIIDTGVDPDSIQCSKISGASFVSSASGESPWWFSYHPHGTQMAKVITEIDPYCRLLVAKVGDSVTDMTIDRVIQALKWAIESKADIISMSLAFFTNEPRFQSAIQEAIAENIVILASTAGEGFRQEEAYPARYPEVLSIAATDYRGMEAQGSLAEHARFMFPGQNIIAKTTFLGSNNLTDEVSGTSVATAMAAGTASLILASHRLSLSIGGRSQAVWDNHASLKRQIVKDVFNAMANNNSGKFVKPWSFFGGSGNQTSWGEARSTLQWLSRKQFR